MRQLRLLQLIQDEQMAQALQMLEIGVFFQSLMMSDWFWISDRFFESALEISATIEEDDGEILNIIKYIYGKFLFYKSEFVSS